MNRLSEAVYKNTIHTLILNIEKEKVVHHSSRTFVYICSLFLWVWGYYS